MNGADGTTVTNGHSHPELGGEDAEPVQDPSRIVEFSFEDEVVEVNLDELEEDADSLRDLNELLKSSSEGTSTAVRVIEEFWRRGRREIAVDFLSKRIEDYRSRRTKPDNMIPLLCMLVAYNLSMARKAPKKLIPNPLQDQLKTKEIKDHYFSIATRLVNEAESLDPTNPLVLDAKGTLALSMAKLDDALRIFERILSLQPTHIIALMGKARILYARRQYRQALKIYQNVLSMAPNTLPDPRIGIGLCFWNLGDRAMAQKAWERSQVVYGETNPSQGANLLLGLYHLNIGRDPTLSDESRAGFYATGIQFAQKVFKSDASSATAAAALANHFLATRQWATATKLGERAVQHADAMLVLSEGHLCIARALHAQGRLDEATKQYILAAETNPDQMQAVLAVAQMSVVKKDFPQAMDTFEKALRRQPRCIEALVNLAAIRSAFSAPSASDAASERLKARESYEQVLRLFSKRGAMAMGDTIADSDEIEALATRIREVARDSDLYLEVARLNAEDDLPKAVRALKTSETINRDFDRPIPPPLLNNIGAMEFALGRTDEAASRFEEALTEAGRLASTGEAGGDQDAVMVTLTYNLGVAYEAQGNPEKAKDMYNRILTRHPEYVEAKARLASIHLAAKEHDIAHDLLKQSLTALPASLELRALYTYFLVETGQMKPARDFTTATLKDHSRHDLYALCASGFLHFSQARENKGADREAGKDRATRYLRAAELFEKALILDPSCTMAAQGIAICLAEGSLGSGAPNSFATGSMDMAGRLKNLRDALTIFTKVRESAHNGSVYVNMGHCHAAREEWDKAIENYETASKRFFEGQNVPTLLYLARAFFHKANKDQSFAALRSALTAAQAAQALHPEDTATTYNIALIQQRGLEILFDLPPERRTLEELQQAIADADQAQLLFGQLAESKAANKPYNPDLAHQRRRFGDSLSKRAAEQVEAQNRYEATEQANVERVRREREAERERLAELERKRLEEIEEQVRQRNEARRQMMEIVRNEAWYVRDLEEDQDEEKGRKEKKKRKAKKVKEDGEDDGLEGSDVEVKKKSAKRKKKRPADDEQEQDEQDENGTSLLERPRKKGKVFKSKDIIDSDEDLDPLDGPGF